MWIMLSETEFFVVIFGIDAHDLVNAQHKKEFYDSVNTQ